MQTTINRHIRVRIELTEEEAIWLKGLMQNTLHGLSPSEESGLDNEMRRRFFDALEEIKFFHCLCTLTGHFHE